MAKKIIIGIICFLAGVSLLRVSAQTLRVFTIPQGGTSTSTAPSYGQILLGNNNNTYDLAATSTLGLNSVGSATSTEPFMASWFVATSTTATSTFSGGVKLNGHLDGGASNFNIYNSGRIVLRLQDVANAVDFLTIKNQPAPNGTGGPLISVDGTTSNNDLRLSAKGTGDVIIGNTASTTITSDGVIVVVNSATPTTDAAGETAFDTNAWAASRGTLQVYDGTAATYVVNVLTSDVPVDGQVPQWNTGGTITWENAGSSNWTDAGIYLTPLTATDGILINAASSTITNLVTVNATSTNATTTSLYVSGKAGIGIAPSAAILSVVSPTNPEIRIGETDLASYFSLQQHAPTRSQISSANNGAGVALIDFDPLPSDGSSNASFRFFRTTNTSGAVSFSVHKGDGTATTQHNFRGNGSSYMQNDSGTLTVGPSVSAALGTAQLSVKGNAAIGTNFYQQTAPTNALIVEGNLGIGTTTPYAKLSVVGEAVAANFTATSTTATSLFSGLVNITGLATLGQASSTRFSVVDTLYVGGTATTTILGNSATSTFSGGLTLAAGNLNLPTGGNITINGQNATSTIILTAGGGVGTITSGAVGPTQTELTTNKINKWVLDYYLTRNDCAVWNVTMPDSYNGGALNAQFGWTATTSSGGVVWGINARSFGDDDALDQALNSTTTVTDTLLATNDYHISSLSSAFTPAGTPAGGEMMVFHICRYPGDVSDTLAAGARLLQVKIEYAKNVFSD